MLHPHNSNLPFSFSLAIEELVEGQQKLKSPIINQPATENHQDTIYTQVDDDLYLKYKKETPDILIEDTQFATSIEDQRSDGKKIEVRTGITEKISIITAPEKTQDAVGISVQPDGIVNIAVADGVSNSTVPEAAARTAVQAGLSSMATHSPSVDTFREVFDAIQDVDVPLLVQSKIKTIYKSTQTTDRAFDKISQYVAQNSGSERLDKEVAGFIQNEIKTHNPDDDVTTVVLQHA